MTSKKKKLAVPHRDVTIALLLTGSLVVFFLFVAGLFSGKSKFFVNFFTQASSFAASLLPGDINEDGEVNIYDLGILAAHWGQRVTITPTTDPSKTPTPTRTPTPSPSPALLAPVMIITNSSSVNNVSVGNTFIYTIRVSHTSEISTNVIVRDIIDRQLEIVSTFTSSGTCNIIERLLECSVHVGKSTPAEIKVNVRVNQSSVTGDSILNQATAVDSQNKAAVPEVVWVKVINGGSIATPTPEP